MKIHFRGAVCAILLTVPIFGTAQEKATLNLSLEQAKEYAVEHNRTLMNASLDIRKAEASRWQAIASLLPQVKGSVDYSNYCGYKMEIGGMSVSMPPFATFGLMTSIGFSGASIVGIQIADISKKMADISLEKSEVDIKSQVQQIYYSALVVEETISLLEKNLASLTSLYRITQTSVDVGVTEQTEADQLAVQVATMESGINSTKRSLELAYNSLRMLLCVDKDVEIVLTDALESMFNRDRINALFAETFILERNHDYQLLAQSTELARKQISLTGWSNGPVLSIYHQYSAKHYFRDEQTFNMTPPNMIGANLSIPIFTFGKTTAAVKDAKLAYEKQLNTMADTELALNLQHKQLLFNLSSNLEKFEDQQKSVSVAQRVFDNISRKFEQGVASSLEVTNANTSLVTAQSNYVQSMLEVLEARLELEKLLNK
ncbi:MAG: TolC family protein [Bacteroidales bacterium]|nr:TolC family protein [Candidatus Cacconaster equifaecalis]